MDLNSKFTTKALRFHIWECGPKSPSAFEIGRGEKRRKKKKKKPRGFYPPDNLDIAFTKPQREKR